MRARGDKRSDTEEPALVVSFGGSCAFVPNTQGSRIKVLLPLDSTGWRAEDGTIVPPHRAFMMFKMAQLAAESPRRQDFEFQRESGSYGICFLAGETLRLPSDGPLSFDNMPIGSHPDDSNRTSIRWIAKVEAFCDTATLNTGNLALAAEIDLESGRLRPVDISHEVFTVSPEPDSGEYRQCLAEEVSLSVSAGAGPYEIGSVDRRPLVLNSVGGNARLAIINEVFDDIILPHHRREKSRLDYDFELFYQLTSVARMEARAHHHLPAREAYDTKGTAGCKVGMFEAQDLGALRAE